MRAVWLAVAAVFAGVPAGASAQVPLPPIVPGPGDGPPLPGGTDVSQPLTPVEAPPPPPQLGPPRQVEAPDKPDPVQRVADVGRQRSTRHGPLGPAWDDLELLLWWPKAQPVPPLVTASRTGVPPVPGNPDTRLLVGGRAIDNQDIAGGRFTLGWAVNDAETAGFELVYFFLGSRTLRTTSSNWATPRVAALGLPFVNAVTDRRDVFLTAAPGVANGSVLVSTTTRVQGAEANAILNLVDEKNVRLNGLVGYRFLQVHEGLAVEQTRYTASNFGTVYDQFDGHNRFNGGQLGLHADLSRGLVFCELTGKVALGQTYEVVRVDGATTIRTPITGGVAGQSYPGGVFALPSNTGRYARGVFAVVPEGTFKIGLKLSDVGRLYVGYNFLYLSDLVRPGDQIDRTVNPGQIAALNPNGGGFAGPDRPRPMMSRTDFWVQGLLIGLETRY